MSAGRLLVVDDEPQILRVLKPSLAAAGYEIESAATAGEALSSVAQRAFDAIILDLGLPDMDGKDVISRVRGWSNAPIVVLSARHAEQEKIEALDRGANDFVNKPFSIGELMARLRAVLRARDIPDKQSDKFAVAHLEVDFTTRRMRVKGQDVRPSPRELRLLRAFAEHLGQVLTHKQIVAAVWGAEEEIDPQFVRVLIGNLRQKVELDPARPQLIVTEPGVGYRMQSGD
ncbi:MAG: response regulator transcription factor [Hyphomonadaceae bacterium]